jgi:gamma-glutamyltranspeptidase
MVARFSRTRIDPLPSEHTMSKENIIVAAQPEAAEAGAKVLMQGGND